MKHVTQTVPLVLISALLAVPLSGCISIDAESNTVAAPGSSEPEPPRTRGWEDFTRVDGENVWIGGQPDTDALRAFRAAGGTTVVNLRTEREMAMMPYYAEAVRAAGLRYVHAPTSGSAMGREHFETIADELDGPVLLHCGSGGRATYAWAMRGIDTGELSAGDAVAWCHDFRGGRAWETGDGKLYEFAGEAPPAEEAKESTP